MTAFPSAPGRSQRYPAWLPLVLAAGLGGCGGTSALKTETLYETKGKVELADGKPLSSGSIELVPLKATVAETVGDLGPDGTFAIKTHDLERAEGVAPGDYRVRIRPGGKNLVKRGGTLVVDRARLPYNAKYLSEESSELTVTVKPEPNHLPPFRLTR
jgi:hypothetical protein